MTRAAVLVLLAVALAPIAVYWNRGMVALLAVLALACVWGVGGAAARWRGLARSPLGAILVALLAWALLSLAWAPDPAQTATDLVRTVSVMLAGLVLVVAVSALEEECVRALARGVGVACVLLLVLFALELVAGGAIGAALKGRPSRSLGWISPATAVLAIVAWPALAKRGARPGVGVALVLVTGVLLFLLPMLASFVAFAAGAAAWVATRFLGRLVPWTLVAAFAVATLAAPWALGDAAQGRARAGEEDSLPLSWRHRLVIWEFVATEIARRPLTGHGIDSADRIGRNPTTRASFARLARARGSADLASVPPLHPHHSALQVWYELGFVGVLLGLGALAASTRMLVDLAAGDRIALAAGTAALASALCLGSLSFGAWQKWWLAALWIAAAAVIASMRIAGASAGPQRVTGGTT